jgi:predicted esterase
MTRSLNRREFCAIAGIGGLSLVASCTTPGKSSLIGGRFGARPNQTVKTSVSGKVELDLDKDRPSALRLPTNVGPSPLPLFLMLHGATQDAEDMFRYLESIPDEAGIAVLAPKSLDTSWDAIGGSFGPDVEFLDSALNWVFERVAIDPAKIAIGGFSDGASYGLSLGLINGDLFSHLVAFSPGFLIDGVERGRPRVYISHGTNDHILPIDKCGRRITSTLKERGYQVTFREFAGDHEIPSEVAREGLKFISG